jgi:hypothetical protein
MKRLPVSQGHTARVDDQDYDQLSKHRWFHKDGYAIRNGKVDGQRRMQYLHREIMQPEPGDEVIFLDGDTLNCQRSNLRVVSKSQARVRHRRRRDSASGYKGVYWNRPTGKWAAAIRSDWMLRHLGVFATREEAARAYDRAAKELHGEWAVLNFPEDHKKRAQDKVLEADQLPQPAGHDATTEPRKAA